MPQLALGYLFPLRSLPVPLQALAKIPPATDFIAISRGIIIRGATFQDLWHNVVALVVIAIVLVASSTRAFKKTIG